MFLKEKLVLNLVSEGIGVSDFEDRPNTCPLEEGNPTFFFLTLFWDLLKETTNNNVILIVTSPLHIDNI